MQYESKQVDFHELNQSPVASAPPATGIPVGSLNQYNQPPLPDHLIQLGAANQVPWSTGLCDCTQDVPNCCITCWCPCIPFGQISEIVDRGSSACAVNGAIYALLAYFTGCACIYSCIYRAKIRNQYNLTEGPCNDCLLHCCCECCALCQEYRELQHQGYNMSIGWQGNAERQSQGVAMAPAAQPGMYR